MVVCSVRADCYLVSLEPVTDQPPMEVKNEQLSLHSQDVDLKDGKATGKTTVSLSETVTTSKTVTTENSWESAATKGSTVTVENAGSKGITGIVGELTATVAPMLFSAAASAKFPAYAAMDDEVCPCSSESSPSSHV